MQPSHNSMRFSKRQPGSPSSSSSRTPRKPQERDFCPARLQGNAILFLSSKKAFSYRKLSSSLIKGAGAMLPKSVCFMLAGLLVGLPLWIVMSYGITADGRPSSPKILIGMTFCFVVGVFWLYEDLKDLLRTR